MNTPVIEMRNNTKRVGDFVAHDGINLTVHKGEIHAILGENGAGKSFPNPGYDYFADLLEGTSFKAEDVWKFLLNEEDQWLPKYYDNSLRLDMRENFFMNSS